MRKSVSSSAVPSSNRRHKGWIYSSSLLVAVVGSTCMLGSAHGTQNHAYHGANCKSKYNQHYLRYFGGAIYNASENDEIVVCPVPLDTDGYNLYRVLVYGVSSQDYALRCRLRMIRPLSKWQEWDAGSSFTNWSTSGWVGSECLADELCIMDLNGGNTDPKTTFEGSFNPLFLEVECRLPGATSMRSSLSGYWVNPDVIVE